jgi:hypothetical protein
MPKYTEMGGAWVAQYNRKPVREIPELQHQSQAERHPGRGKQRPAVQILAKTSGYMRKSAVPADAGRPKVCKVCKFWFAARPREQLCDDCVPAPERVKRLGKVPVRVTAKEAHGAAGQTGLKSDVLGLVFGPGVPLHRQLAVEGAAGQRWSAPPRPRPAGFDVAHEPGCACEACGPVTRSAWYRKEAGEIFGLLHQARELVEEAA